MDMYSVCAALISNWEQSDTCIEWNTPKRVTAFDCPAAVVAPISSRESWSLCGCVAKADGDQLNLFTYVILLQLKWVVVFWSLLMTKTGRASSEAHAETSDLCIDVSIAPSSRELTWFAWRPPLFNGPVRLSRRFSLSHTDLHVFYAVGKVAANTILLQWTSISQHCSTVRPRIVDITNSSRRGAGRFFSWRGSISITPFGCSIHIFGWLRIWSC